MADFKAKNAQPIYLLLKVILVVRDEKFQLTRGGMDCKLDRISLVSHATVHLSEQRSENLRHK